MQETAGVVLAIVGGGLLLGAVTAVLYEALEALTQRR